MKDLIEEERRLFYVGPTRVKKEVTLFFVADRPSEFVEELLEYPDAGVLHLDELPPRLGYRCGCNKGRLRLVQKDQRVGCTRFPDCGFRGWPDQFPRLTQECVGRTASV